MMIMLHSKIITLLIFITYQVCLIMHHRTVRAAGYLVCFAVTCVEGAGNACEDIDPTACAQMAIQNANFCLDAILSQTACPKLCGNCPITCYNCNTTSPDVSSCNTFTCDKNKLCMAKTIKSTRTGQKRFYLGCAAETVCDGGRKRALLSRHSRSVTIDCCDNDLCNTPLATTASATTTTTKYTTTTTTSTTTLPSTTTPSTAPPSTTTQSTTPSSTATPLTTGVSADCTRDIIIMIDQSMTYSSNMQLVRRFLLQFLGPMDIGVDRTQVSLAFFNSTVYSQWELNRFIDKYSLSVAIATLSFQATRSVPDIYQPVHSLFTKYYGNQQPNGKYGDRPNVPDVAIIITGSFVNRHSIGTVRYYSNSLKTSMSVVTIGVGAVDQQTLGVIAKDGSHAFYVNQLADLNSNGFKRKLSNVVCL